jgi:hypothetical protein
MMPCSNLKREYALFVVYRNSKESISASIIAIGLEGSEVFYAIGAIPL